MTTVTPPTLFKSTSVEQQAQIIANYLPNGDLFQGKMQDESVYRNFLRGLGYTNKTVADLLELFAQELDIETTSFFLDEWEASVGIPDSCFEGKYDSTGSLRSETLRRRDILVKLASLGLQTSADFVALGVLLGFDSPPIEVYSQAEPPYSVAGTDAKFTIVIKYAFTYDYAFTYTFPIHFGSDSSIGILICLFEKLKPANCRIIYDNT